MPGRDETGWPKPRLVVLTGDQHDLPPKWDGVVVEWSEWRQMPLTWFTAADMLREALALAAAGASPERFNDPISIAKYGTLERQERQG